jgi:EAL domain-containing protein (putative c-di-GMP-specific phosphodiesterase class I)
MTSSFPAPALEPFADAALDVMIGLGGLSPADLDVVFQPIVDLSTRRVFAYEALARCSWSKLADPEDLFKHAEASGCCARLGRVLRGLAVAKCPGVPLFLNLHPEELTGSCLLDLDDPIHLHDSQVFLEVTESAAFTHHEECLAILRRLATHHGVFLAVDDLGSGHSNLKRVLELEPSIVKLDRTLVTGLHENRRQQVLVRCLVQLCSDLGARVVVEGVESREEYLAVLDTGAQLVQGYFFARPSYPPPAPRWLGVKRLTRG